MPECPGITQAEATVLLLRCADNPDNLAEPLDTFVLLIDLLGADVNSTDSAGRSLIQLMFTDPFLGKFLISRGADVLAVDGDGSCALSMSFEYGMEWMYQELEDSGKVEMLLASQDTKRIERFAVCLVIGGYCSHLSQLLERGVVSISPTLATQLLENCRGNFENMKEPVETFMMLERLGAMV